MKSRIITLIKQLNHRAKIIESSHGAVDVKEIVNTGLFSLELAQTGYGWLQDLHEMTIREVRNFLLAVRIPFICIESNFYQGQR